MSDIQTMIDDCKEIKSCSNSIMTKWESDFVDSVAEQFEKRGKVSEKQEETLKNIWEKL